MKGKNFLFIFLSFVVTVSSSCNNKGKHRPSERVYYITKINGSSMKVTYQEPGNLRISIPKDTVIFCYNLGTNWIPKTVGVNPGTKYKYFLIIPVDSLIDSRNPGEEGNVVVLFSVEKGKYILTTEQHVKDYFVLCFTPQGDKILK